MRSQTHLGVNTVIGVSLYYLAEIKPVYLGIFILWGGLFIDIDHPLLFVIKYKIYNIKGWMSKARILCKKQQAELYIFHSPEVNIILLIFSFSNPYFFALSLSSLLHVILDIIPHYQYHRNFIFIKEWSIIYQYCRSNNFFRN